MFRSLQEEPSGEAGWWDIWSEVAEEKRDTCPLGQPKTFRLQRAGLSAETEERPTAGQLCSCATNPDNPH